MTVAFTGNRPNKLGNEYDMDGPISTYISEEIDKVLVRLRPKSAVDGLALGVDTIAAICCLYRKIPVTAAIPFKGQELAWPEPSQVIYNKILSHKLVTKRYICEPGYAAWKMQRRNEWMVDNCNMLIAVWDGTSGGTENCIKYAKKKGRDIIYIDPKKAYNEITEN